MGFKKITELVSKVKEVKNILKKKKIESPYDKVTIHIKGVESVGYILHPEFLRALIKAVQAVKIGRASALKQLKERWEKLKDSFVEILKFLIKQYENSEKTNKDFITNRTLEIIDNDITSFMKNNEIKKRITELDKNRKKLSELEKKMQDHEKLIAERKKSIQSQEENSRNTIEQVKSKLKEVYQESVEVEIPSCKKEYKRLAETEITFVKVETIDALECYIESLETINKKIATCCQKLNKTAKSFFNRVFKDPTKVSTSILNMFASLKIDSTDLKNIQANTKTISGLERDLEVLMSMIITHNTEVSRKKGEITCKRISLEALKNFDKAVTADLSKAKLTDFLLSCIKLYRLLCGIDTVEHKALRSCLQAVCAARKDSFNTNEILHAVDVVLGGSKDPLEKVRNELKKHEKDKTNLQEELAKVKEELEKSEKEIEKLLTLAEPMLSTLNNVLVTTTTCLGRKFTIADAIVRSLDYLKALLEPIDELVDSDLLVRSDAYRVSFNSELEKVVLTSDYCQKLPLLHFVKAFYRDLTTLRGAIQLLNLEKYYYIEPQQYKIFFACYDFEVPIMGDMIQRNFISTARKFIEWIQNLIELTEHSSEIDTSGCIELLESYENHPYRRMLLEVQKNK